MADEIAWACHWIAGRLLLVGNSAVYRIHTSDDVNEAHEMAQRLLALGETTCGCPREIGVDAQTGTHAALDRYLAIDSASVALSIPADLVSRVIQTLEPHLGSHDQPLRLRARGRLGHRA